MLSFTKGICYLVLPDDTLDIIQTPRPQPVTLPVKAVKVPEGSGILKREGHSGGDLEKAQVGGVEPSPQLTASLHRKNGGDYFLSFSSW